jgi:hypothetical protein
MAENGKDNTNLYLAIGVGGLAFYLWQKQTAAEQAALVAQGAGPLGSGLPGAGPQQITPQPVDPVLAATRAGLEAVLPGSGALAPLVQELGQNVLDEGEAVLDGIIHGGLDWETAGRVAELATAPFSVPLVASYNFVADLFGWSGKPLGEVTYTLLQPQDPNVAPRHDNVQYGPPIYVLDTSGQLHPIPPDPRGGNAVNGAGFSWREVITVSPATLARFPVSFPVPLSVFWDGTRQNAAGYGFEPARRPNDAASVRAAFGQDASFKIGTTELHGPWDFNYMWVNGRGWVPLAELPALYGDDLQQGERLTIGQALVSGDGRFRAVMQEDGNFVIYKGNAAIWATGAGKGKYLVFQTDGNVVIYRSEGFVDPGWATGARGVRFVMQSDGNLVLYDASNRPTWASNTAGR